MKQRKYAGVASYVKIAFEFALANGEKFGIWGGMSERERRRVRRARAMQRRAAAQAVS